MCVRPLKEGPCCAIAKYENITKTLVCSYVFNVINMFGVLKNIDLPVWALLPDPVAREKFCLQNLGFAV